MKTEAFSDFNNEDSRRSLGISYHAGLSDYTTLDVNYFPRNYAPKKRILKKVEPAVDKRQIRLAMTLLNMAMMDEQTFNREFFANYVDLNAHKGEKPNDSKR